MLSIHLVCDALAAASLGCYGSEWVRTPTLDRLAHDGFVFDHCFSPLHLAPGGWRRSSFDFPLKARQSRGIESVWFSDRSATSCPAQSAMRPATTATGRHSLARLLASTLQWIKENGDRDAVAWIELGLVDARWAPDAALLAECLENAAAVDPTGSLTGLLDDLFPEAKIDDYRDTYAARVRELDACIGEFIAGLEQLGLYRDSLISVTADEGWPVGEHGVVGTGPPCLHEERDHIPLIVKCPGGRRGARSPSLATTLDLGPTIDAYFGIEPMDLGRGISLLPLLRGEPAATRDLLVSGIGHHGFSIRTQGWKLILPTKPTADYPRQLYEKPDDRWEFNDLANQQPDIADHLELQLWRYLHLAEDGAFDDLPPLRMDILRRR